MTEASHALTTISPLATALALATEAGDIVKLKDVAAMATALQTGARARGMGIEAENQAAEVVLRAERAIGQLLLAMGEAGLLAKPGHRPGHSVTHNVGVTTLAELGIPHSAYSGRFQQLARVPDMEFEAMIGDALKLAKRIAKVNFYAAGVARVTDPRPEADYTREDPAFAKFRDGAHALLGWEVGESGAGEPTRNGLSGLPDDELAQVAALIKALVGAYTEVRMARTTERAESAA